MEHVDEMRTQIRHVLFVDANRARSGLGTLLAENQFVTHLAEDGRTALDILRRHAIDVLVVDEDMPDMAAPYMIAAAAELSPSTIVIVRATGADHRRCPRNAMIRPIPKRAPDDQLSAEIERAADDARWITREAEPAPSIDPEELLADQILSQEPPPVVLARAAEEFPDFARTMTEQELAATDVIDPDELESSTPIIGLRLRAKESPASSTGVLVFSADPDVVRCVTDAAESECPFYIASNIAQVVKILKMRRPGVLLTDIAEDRHTMATMVKALRHHVTTLVTIALSQLNDPIEMAWLINNGFIFRFLRKPLSVGRCSVCLRAAIQHHDGLQLAVDPSASDDRNDDSGVRSGVFETIKSVRRLLA